MGGQTKTLYHYLKAIAMAVAIAMAIVIILRD